MKTFYLTSPDEREKFDRDLLAYGRAFAVLDQKDGTYRHVPMDKIIIKDKKNG